jgi:UDP-glucuronate 4-epimerase
MKIIGLRFFTIYGKFGRPDMFIYKFLKSLFSNSTFKLNNYGDHKRDFTHIDDVANIIKSLILKKIKKKYQIFNICSNKPINLKLLLNKMNKIIKIKNKIFKVKRNNADVLITHGDNSKIKKKGGDDDIDEDDSEEDEDDEDLELDVEEIEDEDFDNDFTDDYNDD